MGIKRTWRKATIRLISPLIEIINLNAKTRLSIERQKIPSLVERGDWHKYVVLYYSAVFSSATTSASTAGVSATSAAGAASAAFLERRVRLTFFSVLAMFSL